jgi:outer membrane protein OmpA-like peptidoglycan-associated protein
MILLTAATLVGMLLFGCSPAVKENALLEQARVSYNTAQNDPAVIGNAPLELQKAKSELDMADNLLAKGAETSEVEHFAYLAQQRTAIARETVNIRLAEQAVEAASAERSRVLLEGRTLEADRALKQAEALQKDATQAEQRAKALQKQAEEARAEAIAAEERAKKLEAQVADLNAAKSERGLVMTLGDVLFDTNKSELRSGANFTIDKLAAFLAEYPTRKVQIEGFTDSTGGAEYNRRLSERRAEAVRNALVAKGIDPGRIMTRGYGVEFPVASNETAEGRQRNRRVEVIISDELGRILERKH